MSQHATYSTFALIAALALAGLAVVFWWVTRPTELAGGVITLLRIGLVIAAIATVITVVLTGHAGAELVWKGEVGV